MHNDLIQCFGQFLNFLGADNLRIENTAKEQAGLGWLAPSA
jgi:hypothetical protein